MLVFNPGLILRVLVLVYALTFDFSHLILSHSLYYKRLHLNF